MVLVLHLGLEGAALVVAELSPRQQGLPGADRAGRPRQAGARAAASPALVGWAAHELKVAVTTDQAHYKVHDKAIVKVRVAHGGGRRRRRGGVRGGRCGAAACTPAVAPARHHDARTRLGVGERHRASRSSASATTAGRPWRPAAAAAGARLGSCSTRSWSGGPGVLDGNGEATVEVPVNDSLTAFAWSPLRPAPMRRYSGSAPAAPTSASRRTCGARRLARHGARR